VADLVVREATAADAGVVAAHRVAMFRDMGQVAGPAAADALESAARRYLSRALAEGEYRGWLAAAADGTVVAGAGVLLRRTIPSPRGLGEGALGAEQALLLNVYTLPAWRRRGIAERLVRAALAWAAARGVSAVVLHASAAARPLYERLGFAATNEMIFRPDAGPPSTAS
jgi:GNAT superfamily N-acetyltransferase